MRAAKMRVARRSGGKVAGAKSEDGTPKKKPRFEPITAEGAAGKPRLDRPMRKRADGGRTTISEDSKREAEKMRSTSRNLGAAATGAGAATGLMGVLNRLPPHGRALRAVGHLATVAPAATTVGLAGGALGASQEADRIERGLVKPGEEDRKDGGRVKKG